ncbi:ATPase synthesis protein 25 [Penicillium canariense]|uniref:ATPase synthesis protein 25 n=1 Tax=Penicillium canariense TaxID=189055 RepID=A0A9W9HXJ4_9EURO|nr:ATPase synthesis protein 25 [Penicillium canariense]KAJ5159626.1 ATPase synthesis protein 25 [Penicillium canariense]
MSRALLRRAACPSCHHEVLRSFLAVTGVPMPRYTYVLRPSFNSRAFSAVGSLRSDPPPVSSIPAINTSPAEEDSVKSETSTPATSHAPWYLQEEQQATEERPVPGDHIPEIPENSPEILPVLLDYTYKDLGLDQLKLFDLRGLDIPAALGANVIMIVGTARSVKHLNVSADRLCRWLRSKYKLSPYADGLLGRNELKIKLRRKAKRARAASHAGTTVDEKDDGITTGWICVNAGVVDRNAAKTDLKDAGFEGFGQLETGTNVVVQIFTEEKRADLDLDGLWQKTLERAERNRLRDESEAEPSKEYSTSNRPSFGGIGNSNGQRRSMHTARRTVSPGTEHETLSLDAALAATSATAEAPGLEMSTDSLLRMLVSLPHENARAELGTGPDDYKSTVFLQLLYASLTADMSARDIAVLRMKLYSIAVSRQHPAYSKDALFKAFSELLQDGYELEDDLAFDAVGALLAPRSAQDPNDQPVNYLPQEDIELALQVLDRLSLRGVPIFNFKIFNMLYRVVDTPTKPPTVPSEDQEPLDQATSGKEWTKAQRLMLNRLSKIVSAAEVPFDVEEARQLMLTQFRCEDYDGFWRIWRQLPLKGACRTQEDYRQLFQLHADLGEEGRARDCLSTWVPMMDRESTAVELKGPIVTSIMHCLLVADPNIQNRVDDGSPSYFLDLWRRCQKALVQPSF